MRAERSEAQWATLRLLQNAVEAAISLLRPSIGEPSPFMVRSAIRVLREAIERSSRMEERDA